MTFTDAQRGFAALGVPPAEALVGEGDFFATSDAGFTWQRQAPPLPKTNLICPTGLAAVTSATCLYTLPVFSNLRDGTLAAVVTGGTHAQVAFDVTSDSGQHWRRSSQVPATVTPNPTQGGVQGQAAFGYPLISLTSDGSWWVLGWTGSSADTKVTTDDGRTWAASRSSLPQGLPTSLNALDSTQALLTIAHVTPNGAATELLYTQDRGRHWTTLTGTWPRPPGP